MKRRVMKKWIPKGMYCYDSKRKCPWRHYIGTKHLDNCKAYIFRCDYLNYTDYEQDSLLWDSCKECEVKDDYKIKRYRRVR